MSWLKLLVAGWLGFVGVDVDADSDLGVGRAGEVAREEVECPAVREMNRMLVAEWSVVAIVEALGERLLRLVRRWTHLSVFW